MTTKNLQRFIFQTNGKFILKPLIKIDENKLFTKIRHNLSSIKDFEWKVMVF